MVAAWVRRNFDGLGVTQYPVGAHRKAIAAHFGGRALLCIDVSGSMSGARLREAIAGGNDFLTEAVEAGYRCGLVLWDDHVVAHLSTDTPLALVKARLLIATSRGGTLLAPTVQPRIDELGELTGDRVVCVFSDGGIGDPGPTATLAARARALGIRFVVRGLGSTVGPGLATVLKPDGDTAEHVISDVGDMRRGIASMVADLRSGR